MQKYENFIKDLIKSFIKADIFNKGAQIAYYLLFSLFPFMIGLLNISSFTPINMQTVTSILKNYFPKPIAEIVFGAITDIYSTSSQYLVVASMFVSLWAASKGVHSIIKSINQAYGIKETRNFIHLRLLAMLFTVFLMLVIIITLIGQVFAQKIIAILLKYIKVNIYIIEIVNQLRKLILVIVPIMIFAFMYRYCPNFKKGEKASFISCMPGAIFTTISWFVASFLFSIYINNFSNYTKIYGGIGTIIMLMLWMNISSVIILVGGIINACYKRNLNKR